MYLTNNQRLDLNLVGQSDRSVADIQAAMGAGSKYYVQDVPPPAPVKAHTGGGTGGGTGTTKR